MKYPLILFMVVMIMSFFSCKSSEQKFWGWFAKNEKKLYDFENNQAALFNELAKQMHKVNSDLTFEFGPKRDDGTREFVISANGIQSAFPYVEFLHNCAPQFEKWKIIKFRPARYPLNELTYENITIKADDIKFLLFKDENPEKVGIMLFIKGYNKINENKFRAIGFLFLDQALGEYDVEMIVGTIEFESIQSKNYDKSIPIKELAKNINAYFIKH